ncbi:hypothetical protein [Lacrimispora sphenoides]|jgi:hypothetical protein|uniref:hypothetical protein n=1 Tax=Lacrimispora sphenoides TaxID=29370 RepID=UPI000B1058BC|nr:hypothetical protein [Lacrimispora sphenoides]
MGSLRGLISRGVKETNAQLDSKTANKGSNPDNGSGDWYFLDSTKDGPLEGACWHTKDNGAQEIWTINKNDDV